MHQEEEFALVFAGCFGLVALLVGVIVTIVLVWVWCRIFRKAGYPWALGLLMIIPVVNFIMPFVLAFSTWPIERELEAGRSPSPPVQPV